MDVVKPELYWIQDRCYRLNPSKNNHRFDEMDSKESSSKSHEIPKHELNIPYEEFTQYSCDADAPDELDDLEKYSLETVEQGFKGRASLIPSSFFSLIIGAKGSTKKRLESETNTKIIIPRINEKGDIVVRGSKQKDVLTALRRMELMCSQARMKRDITHFACFSLNTAEVMKNYSVFKEKVLGDFGQSVDEALFQEPSKLHLTLCVFVLLDPRERDEITKKLVEFGPRIQQVTGKNGHRITLQGLETMNDDDSAVDVLYAKCVLDDPILQQVANDVASHFDSTGLTKQARSENVKLHATLMNSRWRQQAHGEEDNGNGRNRSKRESFDARGVLAKYGDYKFGTVMINEIRIVTRHTKADDGSYKILTSLSFS